MTPFDVIKTKLQTQSVQEPLFLPSRHVPSPHSQTCCHPTFFTSTLHDDVACRFDPRGNPVLPSFASSSSRVFSPPTVPPVRPRKRSGAASIVKRPSQAPSASTMCAFPTKAEAAEVLEGARSGRLTGLWDGVIKVGRAEGVKGLWRGLTPTIMMTVPSQVTYMTAYDYFRSLLLSFEYEPPLSNIRPGSELATSPSSRSTPSTVPSSHMVFSTLFAGALARILSATLVTPLELARTRLQAAETILSARALLESLSSEIRQSPQGILVLWRGLAPTLWRDVPFSAVYFAGYESIKRSMTGGGLGESNRSHTAGKEFSIAFVAGATSGSFAAVLTHPFDLVKTRLQAWSTSNAVGGGSRTERAPPPPALRMPGTLQMLRTIAENEGVRDGLFKGLVPRVAKVAPACGIMIGSYEIIGRVLG